jgi:predicted esterase
MSHNQIFVAGSLTNEPPGIWQFDSSSGTLICLYSCQEHPFKYTKYVVPVCRTATNAAGKEITYHLWEPVRSSNAKKFPLLIGRSLYSWEAYPEVVANGGDFFVNVDRPAYSSGNLNPWDEDVMTVYNAVLKDSNIDTNAVFLYGFSSENEGLVTLVAKKPDLWKGAILFNPVILPDLSGLHLSKILIDDGIDDASTIDRVIKYQQAAAEAGVPVTLALHKDAGHIYWSNSTKREQAQQLAEFLFGH